MNDWYANPLVPIGLLVSLWVLTIGAIYKFGLWQGKVDADRDSFKKMLTEVRADIKRIFERLPPAPTITGTSPLRLTELGSKISTQLNAPAIADNLVSTLRERIAGMQPYDIQEFCFAYARDEYKPPDDVDALIRQCAFDNGIDREQVLKVIAIELPDRLLPNQNERPASPSDA